MTTLSTVTDLYRYPVKSLRGHALAEAMIGARGVGGDRRWMIVDADGRFLTRREVPDMAVFDVRPEGEALIFDHPVAGMHRTPRPDATAVRIDARIWNDTVSVRVAGDDTNAYLTRALGLPVRLVFQGDEGVRPVSPRHAMPGDQVSLSDGYPLLIVTRASLDALNAALAVPVPIARFRPNLVVDGGDAWSEDRWRRIRIGGVTFRTPKLCSRCIIVTQQPLTGERLEGNEPLTTLRKLGRMAKGGVMFGQNAIPENVGVIRPGDRVEVLETGESVFA